MRYSKSACFVSMYTYIITYVYGKKDKINSQKRLIVIHDFAREIIRKSGVGLVYPDLMPPYCSAVNDHVKLSIWPLPMLLC